LGQSVVAGCPVGIKYGVLLAENSLGVKLNSLVEVLRAVGLVASLLELGRVLLALLLGELLDSSLINVGQRQLVLARDCGGLRL